MQLHIEKNPAAVSRSLAEWITFHIEKALQHSDRFTFVLTGGSSPIKLYELLAAPPYRERIDWQKLHFFWGDERHVPFDDNRNNAKMTFEHLLDKVPVVKEQVHIMDTTLEPVATASAYENILHEYFTAQEETFDLVLNGMGDDGHTLSLFPHTSVIHEKKSWVKAFYLEPQEMFRVTLTAPIVNRAKLVVFLAFGGKKAHALSEVLEGEPNEEQYPSQVIQPVTGDLHFFVDEAAATELKEK